MEGGAAAHWHRRRFSTTPTSRANGGAWGLIRVHDRTMPDLQPLPGRVPRQQVPNGRSPKVLLGRRPLLRGLCPPSGAVRYEVKLEREHPLSFRAGRPLGHSQTDEVRPPQ